VSDKNNQPPSFSADEGWFVIQNRREDAITVLLEPFGLVEKLEPNKEFLIHASPDGVTPIFSIYEDTISIWEGDTIIADGVERWNFRDD
jgi:hypothetical protein